MSPRLLPALAAFFLSAPCWADDWPQWRGPNRDGISTETGLLKEWPEGGPALVWKATDIGGGYSTPSVADGRVFVISDRDQEEFCLAFDEESGDKIWEVLLGAVGRNQGPQYPGSRSTPTVDGDLVYALGSDGDLLCLSAAFGDVKWRKNYKEDFGGVMGMWAFAESPLVDGNLLICTPGGESATLVALNKTTGEVVWKSPIGDAAGYASPISIEVDGTKQYVQFVHNGVVGVDAKTGELSWRYDRTKDQAANIMTPVYHEGLLFSSANRTGGGLIRLERAGDDVNVEQVYFSPSTMAVSIGGTVLVDGYLYGTSGRRGELCCVEFATGEEKWRAECVGTGAVCYADGHLYVRGQDEGTVALVVASPEGFTEKGRFTPPDHGEKPAWPHPIVANGRLYLRDQGVLQCYDVSAK